MIEVIGFLLMFAFAVLVVTAALFGIARLVIWLRDRRRPRYMSKPARAKQQHELPWLDRESNRTDPPSGGKAA